MRTGAACRVAAVAVAAACGTWLAGLASTPAVLAAGSPQASADSFPTGVEVVKAIREQMNTNVIYVTSHPDEVAATRDRKDDLVIAKPFNPRALAAAVQTHLAA